MAKYFKNRDEILKSIDKIANRLTIYDLISYMGLTLIPEDKMEDIGNLKFTGNFNDNSASTVRHDERMATSVNEDLESMLKAA